jgi:hypothetical protein
MGAGMRKWRRTRTVVEEVRFEVVAPHYATGDTIESLYVDKATHDKSVQWEEVSSSVNSVEELDVPKDENS